MNTTRLRLPARVRMKLPIDFPLGIQRQHFCLNHPNREYDAENDRFFCPDCEVWWARQVMSPPVGMRIEILTPCERGDPFLGYDR